MRTIKKTTILLLLCLMIGMFAVEAKKVSEEDFVEITLKTGESVSGYLYSGWNRNYMRKTPNYKFSIVPTRESRKKEQVWYTADEVVSVVFSKSDPQYRWESHEVYHKSFSDKKALRRHLVCIETDGGDAAICWWNQPDGINRYNVPVDVVMYGLVVRDADIVLPIIKGSGKSATTLTGLIEHHMKDAQPEFVKAYLDFVGDTQNSQAMIEDPSVVLDLFRKYWK